MSASQRTRDGRNPIRTALEEDVLDAHEDWLEACVRVSDAYSLWLSARIPDRPGRFAAYTAALDREESAAARYRDLIHELGSAAPPAS